MKTLKQRIGSIVLVFAVLAVAGGLAAWKAGMEGRLDQGSDCGLGQSAGADGTGDLFRGI